MAITALEKPKKPDLKKLKKKCDLLASAYYRRETPYCELAGKDHVRCGGVTQWMHIISRSNLRLRYEPYNKLIGCQAHHVFYTYNPVQWVRFLEAHFPDRLALAEAHQHEVMKPFPYQEWIETFSQGFDD